MACGDSGTDVTYEDTNGDIFYFQVVDDDGLEQDSWTLSKKADSLKEKYIKNKDNYFLLVKHEDQLCFEALEKQQMSSDCKFNVQTCRRDKVETADTKRRPTVFLYVVKNGKYKLVCCDNNGKVHVDTKDRLPGLFEDEDKALFFLCTCGSSDTFKFVPSLCPKLLLGFEPAPNDRSLLKLTTLRNNDEVDLPVDDRCHMTMPSR